MKSIKLRFDFVLFFRLLDHVVATSGWYVNTQLLEMMENLEPITDIKLINEGILYVSGELFWKRISDKKAEEN